MESGVEFTAVDFPQANRLTVHILVDAGISAWKSHVGIGLTGLKSTEAVKGLRDLPPRDGVKAL
jgi:hypothetical protein